MCGQRTGLACLPVVQACPDRAGPVQTSDPDWASRGPALRKGAVAETLAAQPPIWTPNEPAARRFGQPCWSLWSLAVLGGRVRANPRRRTLRLLLLSVNALDHSIHWR